MVECRGRAITILMADDDEDDCLFVKEAFEENRLCNDLRFVEDGEELMDYLYHRGKYVDPDSSPRPGIILLDLNMPKKDGREALLEIKADPELRCIPIVVLTTSREHADVVHSYGTGANSFIVKPITFAAMAELIKTLNKYWFEIVELPSE